MRGVVMADEITEIEVNGHRMPVVVCADTYPGAFIDVTQNRVWLHRGIPIEHRPALLADVVNDLRCRPPAQWGTRSVGRD